MEFLRTPDHRFTDLPDYDYAPNYVEVSGGLRMHYVDANPAGEKVVVIGKSTKPSSPYKHYYPSRHTAQN